jgi:type II secretion system protein H
MLSTPVPMNSPRGIRPPRPRGPAGFSLMELMVVLTVMGILLGVAVPNFVRIGRRDTVETAAYDLQRQMSLARQKAVSRRARYRVSIDPGARTFQVDRREGGAWVPDPAETFGWCERVDAVLNIGGNSGNTDIEFEPQGTVLATDAPAIVRFANAHGDTATVSLVRTGRLRISMASS